MAFAFAATPSVFAATVTWNNASSGGNWRTATNWTGGLPISGDVAQFGAEPSASPFNVGIGFGSGGDYNQNVGAIETARTSNPLVIGNSGNGTGTLTLGGAVVNGNTTILRNSGSQLLTLQNTAAGSSGLTMNVALGSSSSTVYIDGSGGITISSVVTGSSRSLSLRGVGTGFLTLSGGSSNQYTGDTNIYSSTLVLGKNSSVNAISANLNIMGGTVQYAASRNDQIANLGKVTISGGTFALGASNETIGDSNQFSSGLQLRLTGAITISSGFLTVANSAVMDGGTLTISSSGTLQSNTSFALNGGTIDFTYAGASAGGILLRGGNNTGITYAASGTTTAVISNTGGGANQLALNASGTTVFNIGDSTAVTNEMTISAVIDGAASAVQKSGAGQLTFSGANTYLTATTVAAGVLNIQNATALGTTAGGTSVTSGAALQIQGGITVGAEALTLNGTGLSTTGALRNISGANQFGGLLTLGSATRINSDAGTLTLSNIGTISGAGFGLTVGGAGNTTIAGIIGTTSGALTKDGNGILRLTGANTYTGATTINAGKLIVDGSLSASSAITINATGVLGGHGTVGSLTVASGGTISPGNSPGTLTSGDETWNGGGNYVWEINDATGTRGADPGHDWLNIGGALTLNSSSGDKFTIFITSLDLANVGGSGHLAVNFIPGVTYTFPVATATTPITGFSADKFLINTSAFFNDPLNEGSFAMVQSMDGFSLNLTYTAIPEPSTYAIGIAGLLSGIILLRRRRGAI